MEVTYVGGKKHRKVLPCGACRTAKILRAHGLRSRDQERKRAAFLEERQRQLASVDVDTATAA